MNSERIEKWKRLLSDKRLGVAHTNDRPPIIGRSKFDQDYDRIVFSSAFRRLQDKTQVFPLSQSDYTRTRLTHSIEVSCVGRSLGQMAGKFLQEKGVLKELPVSYADIGTIISAACLAHDTGNPPFGHSGESSIQQWAVRAFDNLDAQKSKLASIIEEEASMQDFLKFEGNAQGFRIYSKLQGRERKGGLRLTLATIGTLTKYPRPSIIDKDLKQNNVAYKKFGYFQDDESLALEVFKELGLPEKASGIFQRHPLAFLMEAADDICYAVIDIEDAWQLRILSYSEVEQALSPIAEKIPGSSTDIDLSPDSSKIARLRAMAIHSLTMQCIDVFRDNLEAIENGDFTESLIAKTSSYSDYKNLKDLAKKQVYTNERVLQIEYVGFQAIGGLLEIYSSAILSDNPNPKDEKLRQLFPLQQLQYPEKQFTTHEECLNLLSPYQRLLAVTDYISGMTDSFAVDLYQKLSGIKLPS
jgi:dGTPase